MAQNVPFVSILIIIAATTSFSTAIECISSEKCLCLPTGEEDCEFQCPPSRTLDFDNEYIIHANDKRIEINCAQNLSRFDIDQLPSVNIENATKLLIRYCPLPPQNFKQITNRFSIKNLEYLMFATSNAPTGIIGKDLFEGLSSLKVLDLNGNDIPGLEQDVFANLPNLLSINLSTNKLNLKHAVFSNLTSTLKELDLAQNQIEDFPHGFFHNLQHLESLFLWSNQLKNITKNTFAGLKNLKNLDLANNQIEEISEDAFAHFPSLEHVSLSKNRLITLPAGLFKENTQVKEIRFFNNVNLTFPSNFFAHLPHLVVLDLQQLNLDSLPEDFFLGATGLETIKLSGNNLETLPNGLFEGLNSLKKLYLNLNAISTLGSSLSGLKNLVELNLERNNLVRIEKDTFKSLNNLQILNLNNNLISYIDRAAFFSLENLVKILMSDNNYSPPLVDNLAIGILHNCLKLEVVQLDHNRISNIESILPINERLYLKSIDFSHNSFESININDLQSINSEELAINLEYNKIKRVNFDNVEITAVSNDYSSPTIIKLSHNPLTCDCFNYDLLKYIKGDYRAKVYSLFKIELEGVQCTQPEDTKDILFEKLRLQDIACPPQQLALNFTCPHRCACLARPHLRTYYVNCSNLGLIAYPKIGFYRNNILSRVELRLDSNNLTRGPNQVEIDDYSNVVRLYLSNNRIANVTSLPKSLQVLELDNNELKSFDNDFLNVLEQSDLTQLKFDGNPWTCDCNTINFAQYLRNHSHQVWNASQIYCANTTQPIINLNKHNLCYNWQIILTIVALLLLAIPLAIIALYYRYQIQIKVWLYSKHLCLWWVSQEDVDKDKVYDAFISYSQKDEEFILENIVPILESEPYKVCLHFRDWIPGELITTQVMTSVQASRRTIIILSKNFVESEWGIHEFKTAHSQAMLDGCARVIVVLYGDIDTDKLDGELQAYLKTNTYVKWGDPYFWQKIKYAMPHHKQVKKNSEHSQKNANIMNFIDDKFNLIRNSISSTNTSTPPVIDDDNLAKRHPLSLEIRNKSDDAPVECQEIVVGNN